MSKTDPRKVFLVGKRIVIFKENVRSYFDLIFICSVLSTVRERDILYTCAI